MRTGIRGILERIVGEKDSHEVLPTGFAKLDLLLDGGFYAKELVVIGAHTGVGKSQIAGQIFLTIASQGFKSAYFSLEISNEMIASRLLGIKTNIKPTMLRFGQLTPTEVNQKSQAETELIALGDRMSFYDDTYRLMEITSEIRKNKYEFVVIDFIQNVMDEVNDEYARLSKSAIELQKLAKEVGCTILVLSQLSNSAAREGSKGKNLEYKGSGSIAMVADLGFFLEVDDMMEGVIMNLKKNRRGIAGNNILLKFTLPGGMLYEA